jgi:hypothetical protein
LSQLLAVPLTDDDDVVAVFEVDRNLVGTDLELAAADDTATARARISLERALHEIQPTLSKVMRTVRELAPSEAAVEFGLKVGGESGIIIAKGTTEVNFLIRLIWKQPEAHVDRAA